MEIVKLYRYPCRREPCMSFSSHYQKLSYLQICNTFIAYKQPIPNTDMKGKAFGVNLHF